MPPRRSSRSRASVEPPASLPAPAKRKRTSSDENQAPSVDEEVKPAIKSRKASRAPRRLLDDVKESDEERDDLPPVKKPRASLENESVAGDSEEETDEKPPRARRVAKKTAAPSVAPNRRVRSRAVVKQEEAEAEAITISSDDEEQDEVEEETVKPKPAGRRASKRLDASSDEEFVDTKPARKTRVASSAPRARRGRGKSSAPSRASSSRAARQPESEEPEARLAMSPKLEENDSDESDALSYAEPAVTPAARLASQAKTKLEPLAEDAEEAEADTFLDPEPARSATPKPPIPATFVAPEPQGPQARLVIHKMVLVNFKSYAGRQEIGPFHKSFSSIVGPNGSGKSNTIDALLFVFGYRASKMRQGKLSELIHNSARHPDLDNCSVEVHFREITDLPGPDAFEVVPDSELVVTRTAYSNNSSKYTINGRQSNYKEVQTLLKGRGIDLDHNRFLILQGEVESIAQMKPKAPNEHEDGLLEYLEDIIGTAQYKEPIEEAQQVLDNLNEDRGQKIQRLKIVERERNALEQEKREAEDYLRLQNERVRALSRLWQWYLWRCFENEEAFKTSIAEIEAELQEETDRNKDDIAHFNELEKHYKERCEAYEDVKRALTGAVKDLAAREKDQVGFEERQKHMRKKAKKLEKDLKEHEQKRAEAERGVSDSQEKIEKHRKIVEEQEASLGEEEGILEKIRDSLKDKTQVFHDQIEAKQRELQPWTAKINAKRGELDVAQGERDMLAKKAETAKAAVDEAQNTLIQLQEDQAAKTKESDELSSHRRSSAQQLKSEEQRLHALHAELQELRRKASSNRQKVDEAKSSQAASTSQNKVLDTLIKMRSAGRISGFHGRLGSLGTIPDKYDVAVSTACGALNNLVVDTVEQGQACIEYLRRQNVGRASFMVLEKLSANGMQKIQTPENVPRLFDLIKPKEPRFAAAFYKGVTDTLVAENLEQANRIAFGGQRRWRVVTLQGQLIESSGAMSGGGNNVARGGMSSKLQSDAVSPETLRQYEKESEDSQRKLEEAERSVKDIEATLDRLRNNGPQIEISIQKVTLDLETGKRRIVDAQKRLQELKTKVKPDSGDLARIASLDQSVTALTDKLKQLEEKKANIDKEIEALEKKIIDIGGSRLLAQKSKVDGIRLRISISNDEMTKAEVAKSGFEKEIAKRTNSIASDTDSLEAVAEELEGVEEQLRECTRYVDELRAKVSDAQTAAENCKDDLENLKADLDEKTETIQAFRAKEMELTQKLNDVKKEAKENGEALDHWQMEHDKLRLVDIDDDEDDDEDDGDDDANEEGHEGEESGQRRSPVVKRDPDRRPSNELHAYSDEELATFKKRELLADLTLLEDKLQTAKPNLSVLKDYKRREEEFLRRAGDLEKVTELRDAEKQKYDALCKRRLDEFMAGFSAISLKLKEMYQMITLGGNAELELVDSMDPFSEGIIFSVMPPKKSWKNISNLSGGEKTLSSLALVFALHVYKPTPLYFMDEIDAALDFRNVSIVANYIKDRTKNAQFIIISLRNDMFELSHRLIGIYKTSNATRSISIDNHFLHAPAEAPTSARIPVLPVSSQAS